MISLIQRKSMCYENGWGVQRNVIQMSRWYKKAAAQGEENAIEALKRLQMS